MLCNIEVEKMVLASILLEPQKMDIAIAQGVTPDSFANTFHRRLFVTMQGIARAGKEIEIVSLSALMPNEEQNILLIASATPTTAYFEQWIQAMKEAEAARFVLSMVKTAAGEIEKGNTPIATTLSRITAGTEAAAKSLSGLKAMSLKEIATDFIENARNGLSADVPYFPEHTEGRLDIHHHRREMHVICGDTGTGKTALAVGAVKEQLLEGLIVVFYCTESASGDILARIAAQFSGISHYTINDRYASRDKFQSFCDALKDTLKFSGQLFIRGCESGMDTPEAIRGDLKQIIAEAGHVDVIVIDFIQDMNVPAHLRKASRVEQIDYCVQQLHRCFIECNAAGIVLSQFNREGQKPGVLPGLSHVKDSSKIAQLAHTVSFLYRDPKKIETPDDCTEFYSRKTRNQAPFHVKLFWNGVGYTSRKKYQTQRGEAK